jgi:very-short-patch-repair endonuclease
MRKDPARAGRDVAIASIAARQHGVVSAAQLRETGLVPSRVADRVAAGRLHRIHRGVYAVGHSNLGNEGRWMAAVLACREPAVLSHQSAAELWEIRRPRARRIAAAGGRGGGDPVHVTVPGDAGRNRRRGINLHRAATLTPRDCTCHDGIPVTKPARTLADLRPVLSEAEFAAAIREAEFLRLPIGDGIGRRSGSSEPPRTRTELESHFLALVRRHRLPRPEVNVRIDRFEVDFLWRARRLVVEVDGWESHGTRSAFEEDRARDARLKLLGYEVLRFTWRQVEDDSRAVASTIRALLAARG